jgi:hypothetical protein
VDGAITFGGAGDEQHKKQDFLGINAASNSALFLASCILSCLFLSFFSASSL